jgi:hypothetical protein
MHTEIRQTQWRANAASYGAASYLPLNERLSIAALVTAVNLWFGVAQVLPDNRPFLVNRARRETT